jgi:ABC-type phosphate transport system substrate-binding protein
MVVVLLPGCPSRSHANRETRLNGAGSTFAYPLYLKWANDRQPQLLTFAGRRDEKAQAAITRMQ